MVNLKELKLNEEYYIIDVDGNDDDVIMKFKVVEKLKGGNKRGHVCVVFLKFIEKNKDEIDVQYDDEELFEELYKNDEGRIFNLEDFDLVLMCLHEAEKKTEFEREVYDSENHESPKDYPDWDGDESIMYYIDNYNEEDDEDNENYSEKYIYIESELDYMNINDLLKLLNYLNIPENDIESKLTEFWEYLNYHKDQIRKKIITDYIFHHYPKKDIIEIMNKLDIKFSKDRDWEDLD